MSKAQISSVILHIVLVALTLLAFAAVFVQALRRPAVYRMEARPLLIQLTAAGALEENGHTVYHQTLPEYAWNQPICTISANRASFTVELDGRLLYNYQSSTFDNVGMIHWIALPDEDPSGAELTVSSSSDQLMVLMGNRSDVILYYRQISTPPLIFAFLFLILGGIILALSLMTRLLLREGHPRALRYLGILVVLMGVWVASGTPVAQLFTSRVAVMSLLSHYSFMLLPLFLLLFIRSLASREPRYLRLLTWLHLADLALRGLLQALRVAQLHETLFLTHILMVLTLLAVPCFLLTRRKTESSREVYILLVGFLLLGCCGVTGLVDYYLHTGNGYIIFFSVGVLLFVLSLLVVAVLYVYRELIKASRLQYYQKLASTDLMTRLQSRTAFEDRIGQSSVLEGSCACLMMDINNLKKANDTMGHIAGDELISDAAECVLDIFASLGNCYRMGGDEFLVLLEHISETEVLASLSSLELAINRKNLTRPFPLSLAIGYAIGYYAPIEPMLNEADRNMYQKKQQMKSRVTG